MKDYSFMIDMDRPLSKHPKMSAEMRAAQFSPFAALTGYEEEILDAQKHRYKEHFLSEDYKSELDYILSSIDENTLLEITYFEKENGKTSGCYKTVETKVRKVDFVDESLLLESGETLSISKIKKIKVI